MNEKTFGARQITQWTIVLAAIGLIIFAYFRLSQSPSVKGNPLQVIPGGASLVCAFDKLDGASDELQLFQALTETARPASALPRWNELFKQLDSLRTQNRLWYDLLQTSPFAFQTPDALSPDNWSVSIGLSENFNASILMEAFLPNLPKRDFKGVTLFIGPALGWCEIKNCIILSPSAAVLEDIVIQSDKNNTLASLPAFVESFELRSKDVPLHISSAISENRWITLEPVFTNSGTLLNGFVNGTAENHHPLELCALGGEQTIASILPEKTSFVDALHAPNHDSLWHALNSYYSGSQAEAFWSQAWQDSGDSCQCDLNETLLNWRSGQFGCAVIEVSDSLSESVSFIGISDSTNVIELLLPLIGNQPVPDDGIYTVSKPLAFQRNSMPTISMEPNFVTQYNGFLFLSSSQLPLRAIRNSEKRLSENQSYQALLSQSSKQTGRHIFQNNPDISILPSSLLALIEGMEHWCVTTEQNSAGKIVISLGITYKTKDSKPVQAPEVSEPTEPINLEPTAPIAQDRNWSVVNHNTQEKETLRNNGSTLELLGADGKSLWTVEIEGPVLGDVVQIDALKNNKLQMAFATEKALYILDRNGNPLPGFPYHTKPPITSPLLVADYDNTKKYRLIFAAGDGMLFNFGVDGNPTSGWKFSNSASEKIIAVKTQKIGSDDVILTVTDQGNLQLLKRTGETKVPCTTKLDGFDGKTLDIIAGNDFSTTSIVYSAGSSAKTVQLAVE
jgi:hypothetical protein